MILVAVEGWGDRVEREKRGRLANIKEVRKFL